MLYYWIHLVAVLYHKDSAVLFIIYLFLDLSVL